MLNEMGHRAESTLLPLYADAVHRIGCRPSYHPPLYADAVNRIVFCGCRPSYYLPLYADAVHLTIRVMGWSVMRLKFLVVR